MRLLDPSRVSRRDNSGMAIAHIGAAMTKHILVVDDEAATLTAYKKLLQRPGLEIHTAETLQDAELFLKKMKCQVVISDLRLTGTVGNEGLAILRMVKQNSLSTKVILVTAYGNSEIKDQAFKMGASFYLEKPVLADDLRKAMRSLGV